MKKLPLSLLLILIVGFETFAQESSGADLRREVYSGGFGLGSMIAIVASWDRNRSLFFAFIAGIFSWLYVIWFVLTRTREERKSQ